MIILTYAAHLFFTKSPFTVSLPTETGRKQQLSGLLWTWYLNDML